ncbi:heat- and acid-stable phosphoprotein [Sorochytrium milnesiophthora]
MVKSKMNKRGGSRATAVTRGARSTADDWEPQSAPQMPESSSESGSDSEAESDEESRAAKELARSKQEASSSAAAAAGQGSEIDNPNRIAKKGTINMDEPLSRREREAQEKAAAAARYQKLHAEGKTQQAQADLARLAIIRQQREEAARKREAETEEKKKAAEAKVAARKR